jgi:hypothetical protein
MVFTELISLLEMTKSLVSRKAELDKAYFEHFIEPAWDLLIKIHENYKSSFQGYIEFVESDKYEPQNLIERLRQDSFQTQDFRTELVEIIKNIPTAHLKTKEIYLVNFTKAIANYFSVQNGLRFSRNATIDYKDNDIPFFDIQRVLNKKELFGDHTNEPVIVVGSNNTIRLMTAVELQRKSNPDKDQAQMVLERAVREYQFRHVEVARTYHKLRTELIS